MNHFKLLPCGRVIFYNAELKRPDGERQTQKEKGENRALFAANSTTESEGEAAAHLGLSHVANSDINPKVASRLRRGTKGITSHGRNLIRAGCHWLEEMHGKKNLTFLTATLPDAALMRCTPETWAVVVNRFLKGLRYHLERKGLCIQIVGCTEIQGERLKGSSGIPPLHLHLLFQGRQRHKHWELGKQFYKALWARTCQTVWKLESGFAQACRVESIRSSGVAYMSKYLSKGGEVLSQSKPELLPSSWYTLSSDLKAIIKASVLRGDSHIAEALYKYLQKGELLSWARDVWSPEHGDGSRYLLAWVGQIKSRSKFWEMYDNLAHLICRNTEIPSSVFKFSF